MVPRALGALGSRVRKIVFGRMLPADLEESVHSLVYATPHVSEVQELLVVSPAAARRLLRCVALRTIALALLSRAAHVSLSDAKLRVPRRSASSWLSSTAR